MWYEYPIPADSQRQREIIRQLRKWILNLESKGIIQGFAFNHYSASRTLNLRFDCEDEEKLRTIRKELEHEVRKFVPDFDSKGSERLWDGGKRKDYVYKAYEFGSRCAFLFWELIEKGRFTEEFTSDFLEWTDSNHYEICYPTPFHFQFHFNHGIMNSLGIHKKPNEQLLRLAFLAASIRTQELCEWIQSHLGYLKRAPQEK